MSSEEPTIARPNCVGLSPPSSSLEITCILKRAHVREEKAASKRLTHSV